MDGQWDCLLHNKETCGNASYNADASVAVRSAVGKFATRNGKRQDSDVAVFCCLHFQFQDLSWSEATDSSLSEAFRPIISSLKVQAAAL